MRIAVLEVLSPLCFAAAAACVMAVIRSESEHVNLLAVLGCWFVYLGVLFTCQLMRRLVETATIQIATRVDDNSF